MELLHKMTYENCLKYAKEYEDAGDKERAIFWNDRAKRKYPEKTKPASQKKIKEVKPKEEKK